jgi:hypothetical protein
LGLVSIVIGCALGARVHGRIVALVDQSWRWNRPAVVDRGEI